MGPKNKAPASSMPGGNDSKEDKLLQAVVIADSFDSGFAPLSHHLPRCLFPLANRPLIDYTLSALSASGAVAEIFVYCTSHAQSIKDHIAASWARNGPVPVSVVTNENCHSFGDAMRDLDAKGVLRHDFVLTSGDVVTNMRLAGVAEAHRAACAADPNAAMTLVYKRCAPGHPTRTARREMVVATAAANQSPVSSAAGEAKGSSRVVFHRRGVDASKVELPLEVFEGHPCVSVRFDLSDPFLAVCTPAVPPLFADNFDCQTLDDLVHGVLENDLIDSTLYMHEVEEHYGARISDPMTYLAVSRDVMARWTFPLVPDLMDAEEGEEGYVHCRKSIYKGAGIKLGKGSVLEESVVLGRGCFVGEGAVVAKSCIGEDVKIGKGASVKNCVVFGGVTIGDGVRVEGCLLGRGVSVGAGTVLGERCVLGDSVRVDAGKRVPAGTKLVRQLDDDGFGEEEGEEKKQPESEYGQFAIPFVDDEDEDSDSDAGSEKGVKGGDAAWGSVLGPEEIGDGDSASSDSDDSDFSDFGDQTDILDDEDAKVSVFHREVLESMQRGFAEGINADNLSLEINSSRHAYAATAQQGRHSVIQFSTGLPALT